jgi:uncharacterized repeat protein (TIGR01451 family)
MNWQALNPLRWAAAAKHGAGVVWAKRPRLTKRRIAWGLAASMLAGGGGLYGYQKFGPGRRPAAPAAAKTAQDQSVQPIPDTAATDPQAPGAPPVDPNLDPNAVAVQVVDPNAVDPNMVDPNAVDPNAVDPNAVDPNAVDPNAVDPNAVGAGPGDPNAGVAMAGDPNAGDPNAGDPNGVDPNGGVAVPADAISGTANSAEPVAGQPAVYSAGDGQTSSTEPASPTNEPGQPGQPIESGSGADVAAGGTPDNATDAQGGADPVDNGGGTAPVVTGTNPRSRNSLRTGLTADEPSSGAPVATAPPAATPSDAPAPTAPADLIPVPRRPQPSPPEEHVRLPPEAAPNLSPEGVPGGNSFGGAAGSVLGRAAGAVGAAAGGAAGTLGAAAGNAAAGSAAAGGAALGNAAANSAGPGLPKFGGGSPTLMAPPPAPPYTPPPTSNPIAGNPAANSPPASPPVAGNPAASNPVAGSASPALPSVPSTSYGSVPSDLSAEPGVLPDMGGLPIVASPMPGAKSLEGPQVPMLELQKLAPEEVKVGKPARFEIKVKNIGRVAAQHIVVIDQIPRGTKFLEAAPPCVRGADGMLRWQVGALGPGQETTIVLQLLPEQEGEIGSVAQVIFHSQAAVRTVSTQPRVSIEHQVAERVLIGDQLKLTLAVSNRGSGATTNLVIEATLPESLGHPAGAELEYPIGVLRPNETRRIELSLRAQRPGAAACQFAAREDSQTLAEDRVALDIVAPQLQVGVAGPKVRYLDRQATYSISVANPGTAAATNLEVIAYLPRGLKFLSAENQGQYDPQRHAVLWGLAELPSGVMGASQLVVVPAEPGEQRIRVEGKADLRLEHAFEQPVLVETLSEIQFSVADTADPIEVGSETTYEIKLQNRGSRAASQVRVAVEFPAELTPMGGDGPTAVAVRGQQLVIEPMARLAPNGQATYRVRARGAAKGDPRIRVLVASDESPTPVTKEESTRVYSDE